MASYPLDDTIVAIASPPGGAARAIVRLSGPDAAACVGRLFTRDCPDFCAAAGGAKVGLSPSLPSAISGSLSLPGLHCPLPADLYSWPDAHSYTGQPVAEFHTLGSPPLLDAVLRAACNSGARLAQPGEFTLRAFLAGRIDLTQAEAVLGVVDATDQRQLDVALSQLAGGLSRPLDELRGRLLDLLSHLEAGFDFADEDLPFITTEQLAEQLAAARGAASDLCRQLQSRHRADQRPRVVLLGPPNAGKSSLFNALAQRAGAIVSHHPGTTRDYLSADIDLAGVRFELIDTAGVGHEPIHEAAEQVALRESDRADVRLLCIDTTSGATAGDCPDFCAAEGEAKMGLSPSPPGFPGWLGHSAAMPQDASALNILVFTKADLIEPTGGQARVPGPKRSDGPDQLNEQLPGLSVSSVTGHGLDALRARLRDAVLQAQSSPAGAVASTAARCAESLQSAADAMDRALDIIQRGAGEELVAAEIRVALEAIGRLSGAVCTDDVLDRVFSRFCIGK